MAIEAVRKMSMSRPVGTSNVRIEESNDVAINHRESGENAYKQAVREALYDDGLATYNVQDASSESAHLTHNTTGLNVHYAHHKVITNNC